LFKRESKGIYNVTKDFNFKQNGENKTLMKTKLCIHQRILKKGIMVSTKILSSTTVLNIDNNKLFMSTNSVE